MSRNRYVGDYRLVETIDARGRIRTDYEYIGAAYAYAEGYGRATDALKRALAACCAGGLAFVGALAPASAASKTLWVVLPFAFAALPLGLMTASAARALRAGEKLEHRHADQLENRCPACSFFAMLLAAVALVGEGANLLRGAAMRSGDIAFALGAALLFACGLYTKGLWKRLKCRKMEDSSRRSE